MFKKHKKKEQPDRLRFVISTQNEIIEIINKQQEAIDALEQSVKALQELAYKGGDAK